MMNDEIAKTIMIKKEQKKKTAQLSSQTRDQIHDTKITK
jgi:hypothetical protein